MQSKTITYLRVILTVTALVTIGACYQFALPMIALGVQFSLKTRVWVIVSLVGASGLVEFCLLLLTWTPVQNRFFIYLKIAWQAIKRYRLLAVLSCGFFVGIFPYVLLGPISEFFLDIFPRLLVFVLSVLGAAVSLKVLSPSRDFSLVLVAALLVNAVIYKLATFIPEISTYPFSLGWSETSRYYYASLFFAEKVYGVDVPPSVLHPSRYLMQSIPFLISGLPLWFHRLWQVLLWLVFTSWSALILACRLDITNQYKRWFFVAWAFLFLLIGPVYYHLQVVVIIVLWGFDKHKFWRSLFVVLLASIWAGISRVNWIPVPALIAGAIYLIEMPVYRTKNIWEYLSRPFFWSLAGGVAAVLSQMAYVNLSGNDVTKFGSSFTSNLLWYRLWPNETFKPGILPAILLVSAPLLLVIIFHLRQTLRVWHPIRISGLVAILFTLFVGGLAVSVKIGGGSNLHNLDAYIVLLLIVGTYLYYGQFSPETPTGTSGVFPRIPDWVLGFAIGVPVCLSLLSGAPIQRRNSAQVENALQELRQITSQAAMAGEEVLFISNRHLLLFDLISDVPLIEDYEKIELMEMAMAGNQIYLDRFYADIANHRFAIIISDPLFTSIKDRHSSFSEENNVWVNLVALPLLDDYQQVLYFKETGIQVLEPKQ